MKVEKTQSNSLELYRQPKYARIVASNFVCKTATTLQESLNWIHIKRFCTLKFSALKDP